MIEVEGYSHPRDLSFGRIRERNRHYARVLPIDTRNGPQSQREVVHVTRQWADDRPRIECRTDEGKMAGQRNAARGRFQTGDPTAVLRLADAAAGVAAKAERRSARGDDRRLAKRFHHFLQRDLPMRRRAPRRRGPAAAHHLSQYIAGWLRLFAKLPSTRQDPSAP